MTAALLVLLVVVGAAAGLITRALLRANEAKVRAEAQREEALKRFEEEKKFVEEAKGTLRDVFRALSDDALKSNNQAFLHLAKATLETFVAEAKGDIDKRQQAIANLVKPLDEQLKAYDAALRALEKTRASDYGSLTTQVKSLESSEQELRRQTANLVQALRYQPHVRGRWGELTLRRAVELCGMAQHVDYTEQTSVDSEEGRLRPDLLVHLPGKRDIIVDSKVSLSAYLGALEATSDDEREKLLLQHARQTREHMQKLSEKGYWRQFEHAVDFVVMFIPGEPFFAAAVSRDSSLVEDASRANVFIVTPASFMALLRAVHLGWREAQVAESARGIRELGKDLYDRMRMLAEHFSNMGRALERMNEAYNQAVGSMETRVLPAVRKFKELGATSEEEIPVVEPVEKTPRGLRAPELTEEREGKGNEKG